MSGRRSFLRAAVLAGGLCLLFGTRVYVGFDRVRVKVVQQPIAAEAGRVLVRASNPQLASLEPPFAVIARIRNDHATAVHYAVSIDGSPVCSGVIRAHAARRIDCAVPRSWRSSAELALTIAGDHDRWSLQYLELATHHGHSTTPGALVLPRDAQHYERPPLWAISAIWIVLAALLSLRRRAFVTRSAKALYGAAGVVASGLWLVLLIAPSISPYLVVISPDAFAWLALVPVAPRVMPVGWRWMRLRAAAVPQRAGGAARAAVRLGRRSAVSAGLFWRLLEGHQQWLAVSLAVGVSVLAVLYGVRAVGGADEYGYVSQADLWLEGSLTTEQPIARMAPWPEAAGTFAPLGYRPHPADPGVIVPTYAPGLPLLLALAKAIGGHDAVFLVVPVSAGLLVLATFAIGRRLGSDATGLVGAWLVATSPVVLYMMMLVMTDVPVATAWAWAFYLLLRESRASAMGAGLLSAIAVLIRPNLAPLAGVYALHYVLAMRAGAVRQAFERLIVFGIAVLPGALAIGLINNHWYGSPFTSGYGALGELFAWSRVPENLRLYIQWLIEAQTPFALAGFAAIFVPLRRFWPRVQDRRIFVIVALFVVGLWANYCAWLVFDAWWFTRFLIASWPFIMLGAGAIAVSLCRGRMMTALVTLAIIGLGITQIRFAARHVAFELGDGHRRFVGVARLVRHMTERRSVIVSLDHSGSIRYYGARMTLNYSMMRDGRLDEVVEWLTEQGIRTYAALEYWELPEFKRRFAANRTLQALDARPLAIYETSAKMFLWDLTDPPADGQTIVVDRDPEFGWRAARPAQKPPLLLGPPR